jgi:predicted protein tyrosine phosphatase
MRVLFACSLGLCRSAMAANVYGQQGIATRFGGLSPAASMPLSDDDFRWADWVIVFEDDHLAMVEARLRASRSAARCACVPAAQILAPRCRDFRASLHAAANRTADA